MSQVLDAVRRQHEVLLWTNLHTTLAPDALLLGVHLHWLVFKPFRIVTPHASEGTSLHKNGRPAAIRVVANGINQFYQLRDSMGSQQIRFPYPVRTDSVKIIIADVFKGYKYQDTCIAEVGFF